MNVSAALVERAAIGVVGTCFLNRLWHRLDPIDFRAICCLSVFALKESYPTLAFYSFYHGTLQLHEYCYSKESSIIPLVYGILHILSPLPLGYFYYHYLKEKVSEEKFRYESPPILLKKVFEGHDWMVARLVHLIMKVRSKSSNSG